jgi:hypothetical protein
VIELIEIGKINENTHSQLNLQKFGVMSRKDEIQIGQSNIVKNHERHGGFNRHKSEVGAVFPVVLFGHSRRLRVASGATAPRPRASGLRSSLSVCQAIFSGKLEMLIHAPFKILLQDQIP